MGPLIFPCANPAHLPVCLSSRDPAQSSFRPTNLAPPGLTPRGPHAAHGGGYRVCIPGHAIKVKHNLIPASLWGVSSVLAASSALPWHPCLGYWSLFLQQDQDSLASKRSPVSLLDSGGKSLRLSAGLGEVWPPQALASWYYILGLGLLMRSGQRGYEAAGPNT